MVGSLHELTERGFAFVEFPSHLIILRALTGEHPDHLLHKLKRRQREAGRADVSILIRRMSPASTLPGPSSRNSASGCWRSHWMLSVQRTGCVICRASICLICDDSWGRAVTLETTGMRGSANPKDSRNAPNSCSACAM